MRKLLILLIPLLIFGQGKATHGSSELFKSTSSVIQVNHNAGVDLDSVSWSWECWAKYTNPPANRAFSFKRATGGLDQGFMNYVLTNGKMNFFVRDSNAVENTISSVKSCGDSRWHHFVITATRGDSLRVYIDTVYDSKTAFTVGRIGNNSVWKFGQYEGYMDEIRFYRRAITKAEIIYSFMNLRPKNTDSLKIWLKLDEYTGTSVADSSGNSNNGWITSGIWSFDTPVISGKEK